MVKKISDKPAKPPWYTERLYGWESTRLKLREVAEGTQEDMVQILDWLVDEIYEEYKALPTEERLRFWDCKKNQIEARRARHGN